MNKVDGREKNGLVEDALIAFAVSEIPLGYTGLGAVKGGVHLDPVAKDALIGAQLEELRKTHAKPGPSKD